MENNLAFKADNLSVAAVALKFDIPDGQIVARAYCTVETAAVRFRYDGGTPVAGVGGGHLANAGDEFIVEGTQNVKNFRVVANTATVANLYYTLESV